LTDGVIDNRRIYNTFVNRGRRLLSSDFPSEGLPENTDSTAGEQIRQMLKRAPNRTPNRTEFRLPETSEVKPQDLHDRLRRASVMIVRSTDALDLTSPKIHVLWVTLVRSLYH
jgi:hypothetical protein